jgi:hypothetical protein
MGHYVPASEMGLGHFFSGKSGQQSHHKWLFNRYAYDRVRDVCTYKQWCEIGRSSTMRQDVAETCEVFRLELLRRASTDGDLEAWAAFQQCLEETVLTWLHEHPGSEAACRMHSEKYFVAQAFEQLQKVVVQRQIACETLSGVLAYLRASLNGAILEALRASSHPRAVCQHMSAEQGLQGNPQSLEAWNRVQATLSSQRERRLAYLLYHCGLEPAEIVLYCPQEWSDVHEVARLRRSILERFTKGRI